MQEKESRTWQGHLLSASNLEILSTSNFDEIISGQKRIEPVCVILCHGYGADAWDLFSLRDLLSISEHRSLLICPQAPSKLPAAFMSANGRAWFDIDWAKWRSKWGGGPSDISDTEKSEKFEHSISAIASLVEYLLSLGAEKIILGGFSQGGMVSLWAALKVGMKHVNGLWLLSTQGVELASIEKKFSHEMNPNETCAVLQSHGEQDPILQFSGAQRLSSLLKNVFAQYTWIPFTGGHEIPTQVLQKMSQELKKIS